MHTCAHQSPVKKQDMDVRGPMLRLSCKNSGDGATKSIRLTYIGALSSAPSLTVLPLSCTSPNVACACIPPNDTCAISTCGYAVLMKCCLSV